MDGNARPGYCFVEKVWQRGESAKGGDDDTGLLAHLHPNLQNDTSNVVVVGLQKLRLWASH